VAHAITGFDLSVGFNNRLEIGDGRSENAPDRGLLAMSGQQQQPEATNSGQQRPAVAKEEQLHTSAQTKIVFLSLL